MAKAAKRLRVGVVGTGGIARAVHLPGWQKCERADVVACYDIIRQRAEEAAHDFNIPKVAGSLKELLADPEIDAVDVCTPNGNHKPSTLAALRAGKHVYCEKPIARNSREGQAMVDAARKARRKRLARLPIHKKIEIVIQLQKLAAPLLRAQGRRAVVWKIGEGVRGR